jgi:hypothetical protein
MDKVEEFINAEETIKALMGSKQKPEQESWRKRKDIQGSEEEKVSRQAVRRLGVVAPPQRREFSRLNTNMAEILAEIREDPEFS